MRDAKVEQPFADGDYEFRLGWGQLSELQEKTDCGPYFLLSRIDSGEWRIEDISETIRLGLIGGGMVPKDALGLVKRYVLDRPPMENLPLAHVVLMAGLMGAPEEPPGEPKAPAGETS